MAVPDTFCNYTKARLPHQDSSSIAPKHPTSSSGSVSHGHSCQYLGKNLRLLRASCTSTWPGDVSTGYMPLSMLSSMTSASCLPSLPGAPARFPLRLRARTPGRLGPPPGTRGRSLNRSGERLYGRPELFQRGLVERSDSLRRGLW